MHNIYDEEIRKECVKVRCSAANLSSHCVWLELRFLCPIAVHVWPKSLSSSGRFLCLVAVHIQPKSLSSFGRFLCPVASCTRTA